MRQMKSGRLGYFRAYDLFYVYSNQDRSLSITVTDKSISELEKLVIEMQQFLKHTVCEIEFCEYRFKNSDCSFSRTFVDTRDFIEHLTRDLKGKDLVSLCFTID